MNLYYHHLLSKHAGSTILLPVLSDHQKQTMHIDSYVHDTPDKQLFSKQDRAMSHGCIRVANATKLAEFLLRDQPEWDAQKIKAAMNSGKEQFVKIKDPIPVLIEYYTAWVY